MGNESSSMGDQTNKKKKFPQGGSCSSQGVKGEQNVNEERPDLGRARVVSDQTHKGETRPAPSLQGGNSAARATGSVSLDSESIPSHHEIKRQQSSQVRAGPVVPSPKIGDSDVECPDTGAENNFSSTSQGILTEPRGLPSQCGVQENSQISADPKPPLFAENTNCLWPSLKDGVCEINTLKVNNTINKTKAVWTAGTAQGLNVSSLSEDGTAVVIAAEDTLSDPLHHGKQMDETDEQSSSPSPQGAVGGDQLPAQEIKSGLMLPVPGCKESITEENLTKSTDGHSGLLMMEIQDPKYLTPASLEKHAENVAGHRDVNHSRVEAGSVQLTAEVASKSEDACIPPEVNTKESEGAPSVSEYAQNSSDGAVLDRNELSLMSTIDQHQTRKSEEDDCSFLSVTGDQGGPAKMELLSICNSDFDATKLNVILLPVNDGEQKTGRKEQENTFSENVVGSAPRVESIAESTVQPSIHHDPITGRTKDDLMSLCCDTEQGQVCNQQTKVSSPIIPENFATLESKEKGIVSTSEPQIYYSDSKGHDCEDNVQETKSTQNIQNTPPESPLGFCCDGNQQTRSHEYPAVAPHKIFSNAPIVMEEYSFPETNELAHCPNLDSGEVKEVLQGFPNSQLSCSRDKQDSLSEENLETGQEPGLLGVEMGLSSHPQDSVLNEGLASILDLNSSIEKQAYVSQTESELCEEMLCLQKDVDLERKIFPAIFELSSSTQSPDTMALALDIEQLQTGNSMLKEGTCKGTVCAELPPSSQIPGTVRQKEAQLSTTDNQQISGSENMEPHSEEHRRNMQARSESSSFAESRDLLLSLQDCDPTEGTEEKRSNFSNFAEQTQVCSAETPCQEDLSNTIIPAALQLPAGLHVPGAAEVEESLKCVSSKQTCSNEKQSKVLKGNECSPPATMESTLLFDMGQFLLALPMTDSSVTNSEGSHLSHDNSRQAAQGEINAKLFGEECSLQTDGQDGILESMESMPVAPPAAGGRVKESSVGFGGEQLQVLISEEQHRDHEVNICRLQEDPVDAMLSGRAAMALKSQNAPIEEEMAETFAHPQQHVCESEFKESLWKILPQKPVEDTLIVEPTELPVNHDAIEPKELLIQQLTKGKGCEENLQIDTEKLITRSTNLSPRSEIPSPRQLSETSLSLQEQQSQNEMLEANNYNNAVDPQSNLFQSTEQSSSTMQNIDSKVTENEKLTLNYYGKQKELEENISKVELGNFQPAPVNAMPAGMELQSSTLHPDGIGLKEALLTFTGEKQQSCREKQQQDYEGLQECPKQEYEGLQECSKQEYRLQECPKQEYEGLQECPEQEYEDLQECPEQEYEGLQECPEQEYEGLQECPEQEYEGLQECPEQEYEGLQECPKQEYEGLQECPKQEYEGLQESPKQEYEGLQECPKQDYEGLQECPKQDYEGLQECPKQDYEGLQGCPKQDYEGLQECPKQDYEGLQECPKDIALSISRGLAPTLEDGTTEAPASEGSCCSPEEQQMSGNEFKNGLPLKNVEQCQIPMKNIYPPEAIKLSIDIKNPEIEEQSITLPWLNKEQEESGREETFFEVSEQSLWTEAVKFSSSEVWNSPANCQCEDTPNLEETPIGFSNESQYADDRRKQEVTGDKISCFRTVAENMVGGLKPEPAASLKSLQDPNLMEEEHFNLDDDGKQKLSSGGMKDNHNEENVAGFQINEENIPQFTTTGLKDNYSSIEVLKESLTNVDDHREHQQTCGTARKVNNFAESMSSPQVNLKTSLAELITLAPKFSIPLEHEDTDASLGFTDGQTQSHSGPTGEKAHQGEVSSLTNVTETGPDGSEEDTWRLKKCSDEIKEMVCLEDVHSYQMTTLNALLETTKLIHDSSEVKNILPGFINEQQQACINEAKGNVCEEIFCQPRVVKVSSVPSNITEEHPDGSEKTLLAVVSKQTGVDVLKDSAWEDNIQSFQMSPEHAAPAGTLELTGIPQDHEEKGKQTSVFSGYLKDEPMVQNDLKENIQEEYLKSSIIETQGSMDKQLPPCAQELKAVVCFVHKLRPETSDNLQVDGPSNIFPETISLTPSARTPDVKEVKEICKLDSQLQMVCSCASVEERADGKSVHSSQSAVENIIIPESMHLAMAPQDSDIYEPMVSSADQQREGSSGMHAETRKDDVCEENYLHSDTTSLLLCSPARKDKMGFREKLSNVKSNNEQGKWNIEVGGNISEANAFKLKTGTEMAAMAEIITLPPNLRMHELDNEDDYLLTSIHEGVENEIASRGSKEIVCAEDVSNVKMDGERTPSETAELTLMHQSPEKGESKETSVDFKNEQEQISNIKIKEGINLLIPTEHISAPETVEQISNSQEFGTEFDENKLLNFSLGTEQLTCRDETEISKESAFMGLMGKENSDVPGSVMLSSSIDIGNEPLGTTSNCLRESQQLPFIEPKSSICIENVHCLEDIIPETNHHISSSLHSGTTIEEDILRPRYDHEKCQSLNTSGKESVFENNVGNMAKNVTCEVDPEMIPLCSLAFSEAVERNHILASAADREQLQTCYSQISQGNSEEEANLKVDCAPRNDKFQVAAERGTIPVEGRDDKNHVAPQETRPTESMAIEGSSAAEHLPSLQARQTPDSCLQIHATEQKNIVDGFPKEYLSRVDLMPITKQSSMSNSELENEFLFEIEQRAGEEGRSKEDGVLSAPCENSEVRITEEGFKEGLKSESLSEASEKAKTVPAPLLKPVAPCPAQLPDDVNVLQKQSENISLSVSSSPEKEKSVAALLPSHSPQRTVSLNDVNVLQKHLEQTLSVSEKEETVSILPPVVPHPPQQAGYTKTLDNAELPLTCIEQSPLSVSLTSDKEELFPAFLFGPVGPGVPQLFERTEALDEAGILEDHLEQTPLSAPLTSKKEEPVSVPLPFASAPYSEHIKPLDNAEVLQAGLDEFPLSSISLVSKEDELSRAFLLSPIAPEPAQNSECTEPLDDVDVPQNDLEELPISAFLSGLLSSGKESPPFIIPAEPELEAAQETLEQILNSSFVSGSTKATGCIAGPSDPAVTSSPQEHIHFLQEDAALRVSEPSESKEQVNNLSPSTTFSSPQSDGVDKPFNNTTNLQEELKYVKQSYCQQFHCYYVSVSPDCEETTVHPLALVPSCLPPPQSDDDVKGLQNAHVSVSVSCDSEKPIDSCFAFESPSLSPERITKPQSDAVELQGPVRSSDSEGAFETPEETTPVKVPPQITAPAAEKEIQEQLPSEDSVLFPDNQIVAASESSPQKTDSFRLLPESASIVFDEDKPIASSGAYKIDFDSLDVLDSFHAQPSSAPSLSAKLEGSEPGRPAGEKSPHTLTTSSPPAPQSPPFSRKSAGIPGDGGLEDVAKTLPAEAFSIASDAPSVKKKKPRPLSLKKKTKSEKPAETPAEQTTEAPTLTEGQTRTTVPKTSKEANASESSLSSLHSINQQESLLASNSFDQYNLSELNPFASGDKLQPAAQSESETTPVGLKELDKVSTDSGRGSDSPVVGHAVRLEFDYSEDKDNFETSERKPIPKKFGKKSGGKMPLRKPKLGIKKVPTVEKVDSAPSYSTTDPDDIPIPKTTYSFDPSKWDDPNFNPFNTNVQVPNSPKLPHTSSKMDTDNCEHSADPFKSSTKISGSPSHSAASFEVNDDMGASEGDSINKSSKKKRLPLKTNTFRVKRSPKRTSLSETSSQDSTPLTTPETPPVIGTVDHATDEEKLASSVTNQKWSYSGIQSELEEDKPDYPQPSDLSAFVNENSEFENENFSSAVLGYEQSLEIEYMEKLGSSSPHHESNAKKQSMYLKIDSLKDSPILCPPIRLSVSATSCSGSSLDDVEDGVLSSAANKLSGTLTLASSQETHLHSPDKQKEMDSLSSSSAKSDQSTPEEPVISADALLSRIVGHTEVDELDHLQPDTAEKNPSVFASKLQQRDRTPLMDSPITKGALYSRTGESEVDDPQADGHHYNQRDLDSALRAAREEIVEKEREAADWKRKYDESKQEVVEMRRIVAEYEKTIAQMIEPGKAGSVSQIRSTAETTYLGGSKMEDDHREKSISHHTIQQLIMEKDQALSDLNSVEKSLADLFRRYEKMKDVLEGFRKNEEVLKKCAQEYLARVKKEEQRYHALKIHAEEKLDKANAEIAQVRAKSKSEQTAFQASLRKEQMKVESLERTLEQKNKEVEELTKICDELIAKMGKS
ncbi:microtubule-associated protein futsch-like isoform X2 [Narcine bancroftii]|uniref:microtubule-associated protein futsch-like isoform X2 n=1 Tax=Narcine bancroftii TaxID=1343680 RepID=UPI0038314C53